jgi:hypothetical protein
MRALPGTAELADREDNREAVDCSATLANGVDAREAIERLLPAVAAIPNVLAKPAPSIEILSLTRAGRRSAAGNDGPR